METTVIILWVYIVLLIAGGLMGYIKAKSKASIIASSVFALPLILATMDFIPATAADILIAGLAIMFGAKFIRSGKFMPGGMMGIASLIAFVLRLILHSPTP